MKRLNLIKKTFQRWSRLMIIVFKLIYKWDFSVLLKKVEPSPVDENAVPVQE